VSRIFHHTARSHLDELDLARTLALAAVALGDGEEVIVRSPSRLPRYPQPATLGRYSSPRRA
jgi:hypothetical protein